MRQVPVSREIEPRPGAPAPSHQSRDKMSRKRTRNTSNIAPMTVCCSSSESDEKRSTCRVGCGGVGRGAVGSGGVRWGPVGCGSVRWGPAGSGVVGYAQVDSLGSAGLTVKRGQLGSAGLGWAQLRSGGYLAGRLVQKVGRLCRFRHDRRRVLLQTVCVRRQ